MKWVSLSKQAMRTNHKTKKMLKIGGGMELTSHSVTGIAAEHMCFLY